MKVSLAVSILLAGASMAMLFRQQGLRVGHAPPTGWDSPALRERFEQQPPYLGGVTSGGPESLLHGASRGRPATVISPQQGHSTPQLPKKFPGAAPELNSRWGTSMAMGMPEGASPETRTRHRIVDGDTLAGLAERYLGSADRAGEIYQANAKLLPNPALLPIGATLTIPPRRKPLPSEGEPADPH